MRNNGGEFPTAEPDGFFGIRFESIGGQGAHLAGQILAEAGVLRQGLNGAYFSSYGSEKKGSPVKSYVRFCPPDQEVRSSSPVDRPHLVAVFHEALIKTEAVAAGLLSGGTIIVNTPRSLEETWERLGRPTATVGVVDALTIAVEEASRVNTAMLGAVARASGLVNPAAVREVIEATLGRRYPQLLKGNLRTFGRGYAQLALQVFKGPGVASASDRGRSAPRFGFLDAPIGGVVVTPGNTALKDLTASRNGFIPAFHREKCVDCAFCDLVCPDFCFVWEVEETEEQRETIRLRGIDYRFCKGCMKCIDACPTYALTNEREVEGYADAHRVPLFPHREAHSTGDPSQTTEGPASWEPGTRPNDEGTSLARPTP